MIRPTHGLRYTTKMNLVSLIIATYPLDCQPLLQEFAQPHRQCDQMGDLLDFGQLFKAFGNN